MNIKKNKVDSTIQIKKYWAHTRRQSKNPWLGHIQHQAYGQFTTPQEYDNPYPIDLLQYAISRR